MDVTAIGAVFTGIAGVLTAWSAVSVTRNKRQQTRLELLDQQATQDAATIDGLRVWQQAARSYLAELFNWAADNRLDPPEPPAELGLRSYRRRGAVAIAHPEGDDT